MKLAIVSPQFPFSGRVPLVPPILEYLAALTHRESPGTDVKLFDANQRLITPEDLSAETVAISVMTATAPWAYRFADECRKIGKRVVLGGIHPSALPEEAALHADSVVVGEAESVWAKVLSDARNATLQKFYHGERLALDNLPMPIDGKLQGNYQFRAFFTMRGCPYRCTFCSVRRFFGDTIRYRPIADVVEEINTCAGNLWFNGDDNIWGGDHKRSIDLFDALAQEGKGKWYGFGDLKSIQGEKGAKMLAAARRSGLFSVWVGWEGDEQYLGSFNASGKQGTNREAAVKQMQDAGIDVTLFVVLGGRQDSIDSFKRTLELSERLQVGIHPVLLTPLPGTELYDEYRPYLLDGLGWESFTGVNAVFEHPSPEMTPRRREEEYHRLSNELFRFERIAARVGKISSQGFPSTHLYSFMMQIPMKHALSKAYEEWKVTSGTDEGLPALPDTDQTNLAAAAAEGSATATISTSAQEKGSAFGGVHWPWVAFCLALTLVDLLESMYFENSGWVDFIEINLFVGTFLIIAASLIVQRKKIYQYLDILINASSDGKARKSMLIKQGLVSTLYMVGQIWGYVCVLD